VYLDGCARNYILAFIKRNLNYVLIAECDSQLLVTSLAHPSS
jgi:hypothetical protein